MTEQEHTDIDDYDKQWVERAFTHHPPKGQTDILRYQEIREFGKEFALHILRECPDTGDRSTALLKIREAVMWANASIACCDEPTQLRSAT